jgi:hypothetical protein
MKITNKKGFEISHRQFEHFILQAFEHVNLPIFQYSNFLI